MFRNVGKCFGIANIVLKSFAREGMTLYQIGMFLFRPGFEETPSEIEILMEKNREIMFTVF